jgi:hypothetical protein
MTIIDQNDPNVKPYYITYSALSKAIKILLSAFVHISSNYSNRGFKHRTPLTDDIFTCVLGAIDIATMAHMARHVRDDDLAVIIINAVALDHFKQSAVSVNDDLGYHSVVKLFALSIERAFDDAARIGAGAGRVEYRATGEKT